MSSKRRMFFFFAVMSLFNMAASFAHPVTPTLFKALGLPDHLFGYALGSMMVVNFLFSPFWGRLNSCLSSRVSLLISCSGYALGQFFFAISTTELQFIFARAFAGLFTGGVFVSMLNYTVNLAPDSRVRGVWLTASATIQSVAGAFGYFVGGMLGSVHVHYALIAQIGTLALCGVLFMLVCDNDMKVPLSTINFKQLVKQANPFRAFIDGRAFIRFSVLLLFVMCALQNLGQEAFDQSFNYYIKDQFDFTPAYNGALKAAMGLITLIANSTICVYLVKKSGKTKSLMALFALSTLTMIAIINLHNITLFLIANVLFYALSTISLPLLQVMAADNTMGNDSNLVMGFFYSMRSLGGIAGALGSGFLYAHSPIYPFVCIAAAFGLATLIGFIYHRRKT